MIKKNGTKWCLYSKDGSKMLGEFSTKAEAIKREQQINYFKNKVGVNSSPTKPKANKPKMGY